MGWFWIFWLRPPSFFLCRLDWNPISDESVSERERELQPSTPEKVLVFCFKLLLWTLRELLFWWLPVPTPDFYICITLRCVWRSYCASMQSVTETSSTTSWTWQILRKSWSFVSRYFCELCENYYFGDCLCPLLISTSGLHYDVIKDIKWINILHRTRCPRPRLTPAWPTVVNHWPQVTRVMTITSYRRCSFQHMG